MSKTTIISALVLSVAILSAQSPAQASINPETFGYVQSESKIKPADFVIGYQLEKSAAFSSNFGPAAKLVAEPLQVAWSITGAVKKIGGGIKSAARATGKAASHVNRVVVPSEIRHGAGYVFKKAKAGAKYVAKHPYGKRCKPSKYLIPACTVKGTGRRLARDHRN